jgi:pimeloyl-ACP methyl ester carboxylesterase
VTRTARVAGHRIAYDEAGSGGVPAVLVHGLGGGRWSWDANLPALAASRRTIALDLAGHGESDKPAIDYTVATHVGIVVGFLDALGIDRAFLVGNSMGGLVSLTAALERPDRVAGIVLANAAGATRFPIEKLPADPRRFVGIPITIRPPDRIVEGYVRFLFVKQTGWHVDHSLAKSRQALARDDYPAQANAFLRSAVGVFESDAGRRVGDVRRPALVVWGEADRLLPRESLAVFSAIPGARVERLAGVGHVPQMEAPERFNAVVSEFLAEAARAPTP